MNTSLITMDPELAKAKLKEYRRRLGKMKGREVAREVKNQYETARAAYYELAKGTAIVDIVKVMTECPIDAHSRPKLAICRADATGVCLTWSRENEMTFDPFHARKSFRNGAVRVPLLHSRRQANYKQWSYARVPLIPAEVRPETGKEEDWSILWEVDAWSDNRRDITPDRDPYLLKHLGGSLYAVLAEWDLTDLEQAIMRDITHR